MDFNGASVRDQVSRRTETTSVIICDSVPFCVAVASSGIIFFVTTRKSKVLHLLQQTLRHNKASSMNALHNTTVADASRTADEDEDEDEARRRNVRANTNEENRKVKRVSDGRNSKRVTGIVTH